METIKQLVDENALKQAQQGLRLLRSQIAGNQLEPDFATRQLDRVIDLLEQLQEVSKAQVHALRLEALYNVTRALGTSLELEVVLAQVMDAAIQLTAAERGFLMLRDDDGNLRVQIGRNFDQQTLDEAQASYSQTVVNHVLTTGEAVLTTNAVEDPRFQTGVSIVTQGMRSIMACPLRVRDHIMGVAYVENRAVTGLFGPDDLSMLEALASQASIAIDNARLFSATDAELARVVDELRTLRRIDQRLNEKLDYHAALHFTLETACQLTDATCGCLALPDPAAGGLRPTAYWPSEAEPALSLLQRHPHMTEAYQAASTEKLIAKTDYTAVIPIWRNDLTLALILLERTSQPIDVQRLELVERFAARAAITIDNASLYAALQAADRAKTEFVGVVAHDLKSPMTSIQGYTDLLLMQRDSLTERQISFLERINSTVQHMQVLISDLADISRLESGHFLLSEMAVDANAVIEAVCDQTLPPIQARGHRLIVEVAPDLPPLRTDYYRLVQVLTNLMSNAYKYTPNGGEIRLIATRDGQRVRFSVSDTGVGLSPDNLRHLGTKFWRADDPFTRSQPGTGLGYAIASSIVEQMGSHIEITSEVGKGSTFTFTVATME